jgi:urease beta subunit
MKPGEIIVKDRDIICNEGRKTKILVVANTGDRPVQVGSHFHFFEVNKCLQFDREEAFGMRLDIPSGTAVRFEPGEEKEIQLVELGGKKLVYGLNDLTSGSTDESNKEASVERAKAVSFKGVK